MIAQEQRGPALLLRLQGLDANGMFTQALLRELAERITTASDIPDARCIVLAGSGAVFCRGGNVGSGRQVREGFARDFRVVLGALADSPLPVMAAVNGACAAGGMTLLAAADYAACVDDATFGYPELAIGAFPMLAAVTAPRHLPKKVYFELAYGSQLIDAAQALRLALVNEVVSGRPALEAACDRFAELIAQRNRESIAAGRRLYHQTVGASCGPWLDAATQAMAKLPELPHYR